MHSCMQLMFPDPPFWWLFAHGVEWWRQAVKFKEGQKVFRVLLCFPPLEKLSLYVVIPVFKTALSRRNVVDGVGLRGVSVLKDICHLWEWGKLWLCEDPLYFFSVEIAWRAFQNGLLPWFVMAMSEFLQFLRVYLEESSTMRGQVGPKRGRLGGTLSLS